MPPMQPLRILSAMCYPAQKRHSTWDPRVTSRGNTMLLLPRVTPLSRLPRRTLLTWQPGPLRKAASREKIRCPKPAPWIHLPQVLRIPASIPTLPRSPPLSLPQSLLRALPEAARQPSPNSPRRLPPYLSVKARWTGTLPILPPKPPPTLPCPPLARTALAEPPQRITPTKTAPGPAHAMSRTK